MVLAGELANFTNLSRSIDLRGGQDDELNNKYLINFSSIFLCKI